MPALNTTTSSRIPTEEEQEDAILSCRYGDLDDVRQFVDTFGVSALAAARDENGNSVLHMCCANGHEGEQNIELLSRKQQKSYPPCFLHKNKALILTDVPQTSSHTYWGGPTFPQASYAPPMHRVAHPYTGHASTPTSDALNVSSPFAPNPLLQRHQVAQINHNLQQARAKPTERG